jgi:hypothetical protein
MSNRWLRFVIALLALGAAGAAGTRIYQQERLLAGDVATVRASDLSAESAVNTISELKAALHAYVAQGQGYAFWTTRAEMLLDRLRVSVLELDGAAVAVGVPLTETLDMIDRLVTHEQRAREHVRVGEELLAGEIVFREARDLLDAMRLQIARAREQIDLAAGTRQAAIRREQALLGLGAAGILGFAMLLLVIPGRGAGPETLGTAEAVPATATPAAPATSTSSAAPAGPDLGAAASVCTDLARVAQTNELSGLLERAAQVLDAAGVVVWMSSQDRSELFPAASAGYDDRILARIGSIPRGAANVTAAAFRDAAAKSSPGIGSSAAALAVPLLTPLGPAGVLSVELRDATEVDARRMALAAIFAAQLASLLGSMAPPVADATAATAAAAQAQG